MPTTPVLIDESLLPSAAIAPEDAAYLAPIPAELDGEISGEVASDGPLSGWEEVLERVAADLYRVGSMLTGEGEDTIGLIEEAVAAADVPDCCDQAEARHSGRLALGAGAISLIERRNPGSFPAPEAETGPASCIEDDDLSAAGVTHAEFEQMLTGPDRDRLRNWLEGFSAPLRVVFVLRGIAGLSTGEVAGLLAENGGPQAQDWTPDAVRGTYRQGLCSLASQLLHSGAAK
jgi:hypothetical protein